MTDVTPTGLESLEIDEISLLVRVPATWTLVDLEFVLRQRGLTLGPPPHLSIDSTGVRTRTIGAMLATPRPSEATSRGRFVERCAAIEGTLLGGQAFATRCAPRRASGPDFSHAFIGAGGATGAISAAWLRCARIPAARAWLSLGFGSKAKALQCARKALGNGARPADLAGVERRTIVARMGVRMGVPVSSDRPALLLVELDGLAAVVDAEAAVITDIAASCGGAVEDRSLAETWFRSGADADAGVAGSRSIASERYVVAPALAKAWAATQVETAVVGFTGRGAAVVELGAPTVAREG